MNWLQVGANLLNTVRPDVAGHRVTMCRDGVESIPFYASSPPSGHEVVMRSGLTLSQFDRVFMYKIADNNLGVPQRGDVIKDENNELYTVRPSEDGMSAWAYLGQNRDTVICVAKRDF